MSIICHHLSLRYLNVDNDSMEVSNVPIFVPPLDNVSSIYEKLRRKKKLIKVF